MAMTDPLSLSQVSKEKRHEYRWEQHTRALHEDALKPACKRRSLPVSAEWLCVAGTDLQYSARQFPLLLSLHFLHAQSLKFSQR